MRLLLYAWVSAFYWCVSYLPYLKAMVLMEKVLGFGSTAMHLGFLQMNVWGLGPFKV